jgi:cytochrome d ubiquinol oxidase subunit I
MVAKHQPAKLAAFEGHFKTGPAGLNLFGIPDEEARQVRGSIAIPGGLSLLIHEDMSAPVIGLDKIPREYWPPVTISFISYHVMVGLGMYFIALTLLGTFLRWKGMLFANRAILWVFVISVIGPYIANQLGWVAAEVGRQPWIVHPTVVRDASGQPVLDAAGLIQYNLAEGLMTRNAVSKTITGGQVLSSIIMFSLIYLLLGWVWLYVLNDKIQKGPKPVVIGGGKPPGGWLKSAAGRTLHQESLSEAKEER